MPCPLFYFLHFFSFFFLFLSVFSFSSLSFSSSLFSLISHSFFFLFLCLSVFFFIFLPFTSLFSFSWSSLHSLSFLHLFLSVPLSVCHSVDFGKFSLFCISLCITSLCDFHFVVFPPCRVKCIHCSFILVLCGCSKGGGKVDHEFDWFHERHGRRKNIWWLLR